MRIASILLLAALALPQESVESLIKQLGAERVEDRKRAEAALVELGESAREAVKRAEAAATDPETKSRLALVLTALDLARDQKKWSTAPAKVSLSGEMTLEEGIRSVEKQVGLKIACDLWPDGKLKVELKDVSTWEAVEALCKASGKRTLSCDAAGPRLVGDRDAAIPSATAGDYIVQYGGSVEELTNWPPGGPVERKLTFLVHVAWKPGRTPWRAQVRFLSVVDDLGDKHTNGFQQQSKFKLTYSSDTGTLGESSRRMTLEPSSMVEFDPKAARIPSLRGKVLLHLRGSDRTFEIPLTGAAEEWRANLEIVNEETGDAAAMPAIVRDLNRLGDSVSCRVEFTSVEARLGWDLTAGWFLWDKSGRRYDADLGGRGMSDKSASFDLKFRGVPKDAALRNIEVGLPRRLILKEIPFDFKDVRIK